MRALDHGHVVRAVTDGQRLDVLCVVLDELDHLLFLVWAHTTRDHSLALTRDLQESKAELVVGKDDFERGAIDDEAAWPHLVFSF